MASVFIDERSDWDRGFISNPFAGDDVARLGLKRTRRLLDALGNPDRRYAIVHVAGSKGKGSTCSFVESILRSAGNVTGRYLSPHLFSYRERLAVEGVMIGEQEFADLVLDVRDAVEAVERAEPGLGRITAFELLTAAALEWFGRRSCEVVALEVGLGGTLDATNVVTPVVSVITHLDYEHTAILGSTLEEIASNKAGIIKQDVPVICAPQQDEAMAVIRARAEALGSRLIVLGTDFRAAGTSDAFSVTSAEWSFEGLRSALRGRHQVENAALAITASIEASRAMGKGLVTRTAIRAGLAGVKLAGRFDTRMLPGDHTLVVDGAHTPDAIDALVATIDEQFPDSTVTAIVGMLKDKDPVAVLPGLARRADRLFTVTVDSPRAWDAAEIAQILAGAGIYATPAASMAEALTLAINDAHGPHVTVATGSMTVVAAALAECDSFVRSNSGA